jgi:hypothetical protein
MRVTVNFDIVPRQALTPADFKSLGRTIRRWLRLHAKQQGTVRWYDADALEGLLKGVPPQPSVAEDASSSFEPPADGLAVEAASVAVLEHTEASAPRPICLSLIYNKDCDHRHVMASVRRALATELVADVLIEGRSWDDQGHGEWIGVRRAMS